MLSSLNRLDLLFASTCLIPLTLAHIALWDPAMYGWDNNPNQNDAVTPLYNLPFSQWWFHGYIDQPPADGTMMVLPAGGTYHGQVSCNKGHTSYSGELDQEDDSDYACDLNGIGSLHTADTFAGGDPKDVKGCGIAIAYESDVSKIQPEDFAVISISYTCPWMKKVDFEVPSDLPACPEGGCHCMWGWIHSADSGSEQIYFVGYRCNVTGATGTQPLPQAKVANRCDYPTDTSNCTIGAKNPHYWLQQEKNNNFQGYHDPPFYNQEYGFMDGAQTDLFAGVSGASSFSKGPEVSSTTMSATSTEAKVMSTTTQIAPGISSSLSGGSSSVTMSSMNTLSAASTTQGSTSGTMISTSATSTTADPSATSHAACKRRRRALSNLSSAESHERHQRRQARRSARQTAERQDVGRFARAQKEWRETRERSGLGLRSLGVAPA